MSVRLNVKSSAANKLHIFGDMGENWSPTVFKLFASLPFAH